MARGLLVGGLCYSIVALASFIATAVVPMWLVNRVELENTKCWQSTGIWTTNYRFGGDLPSAGLTCQGDAPELQPQSTHEAYCEHQKKDREDDRDTDEYKQTMCSRTNTAKVIALCTIVLSLSSILASIYGHISVLRGEQQLWPSAVAVMCSTASFAAGIALFVTITTSPLYSLPHFFALDGDSLIRHNDGMSCIVRVAVPFVNPTLDMPLNCIFPGPSFATALTGIVSALLASILFALKAREIVVQHTTAASASQDGNLRRSLLEDTLSPLQIGYTSSETGQSPHSSSGVLSSVWVAMFSPGGRKGVIPAKYRHPRRYSLYGAYMRKWARHRKAAAFLFSSIVPLLALFNVVIFAGWTLYGTSFGIHVWLGQVQTKPGFPGTSEAIRVSDPSVLNFLDKAVNWSSVMDALNAQHSQGTNQGMHINFTVDVLEYSPIMSWTFFQNIGGYFFLIVQLVACIVWPVLKAVIWFWMWFTPMQEATRGRIATWVDALGKFSLANVYTLAFFALVNRWESAVILPRSLLPSVFIWPDFDLQLELSMHVSAGFGTYSFALACVLSMLIGEVYVYSHRKARGWEEQRREKAQYLTSRRPSRQNFHGTNAIFDSPGFSVFDTPFQDMSSSGSVALATPSPMTDTEQTPPLSSTPQESGFFLSIRNIMHDVLFSDKKGTRINIHGAGYETLCGRLYTPLQGQYHQFTIRGRVVVSILIILSFILIVGGLVFDLFEFRRIGFVGQYFVTDEYRVARFSAVGLLDKFSSLAGSEASTPGFAVSLFLFTIMGSLLNIVGLMAVWIGPMRLETQLHVFHIMEVLSAWSAAEIFLLSIVVIWWDVKDITTKVLKGAGFGFVDDIFAVLFPSSPGLYVVEQELLDGFWLLLSGVVLEKLLGYYILQLFATSIAERSIQSSLDSDLKHTRKPTSETTQLPRASAQPGRVPLEIIHEENEPLSRPDVLAEERMENALSPISADNNQLAHVESTTNQSARLLDASARMEQRNMLGSILRSESLDMFSPAGRYFGASGMTETVYAGQLRGMWRIWEMCGMMKQASLREIRLLTPKLGSGGNTTHGFLTVHQSSQQQPGTSPYFRLDGDGLQ